MLNLDYRRQPKSDNLLARVRNMVVVIYYCRKMRTYNWRLRWPAGEREDVFCQHGYPTEQEAILAVEPYLCAELALLGMIDLDELPPDDLA